VTLARRWSGVEGVEGTDHGTHEGRPALLCRRACTDQHTVVACASGREQFNSSASILANFWFEGFEELMVPVRIRGVIRYDDPDTIDDNAVIRPGRHHQVHDPAEGARTPVASSSAIFRLR